MAKFAKPAKRTQKPAGVADRLNEAQKDWKQSEARSFGAPLPDGLYEGLIETVLIEESRNGRLQVRWDLTVTAGECEGRQIRKFNGLETKDNMDWFKGDLDTLGIDIPDDITELGEALESAQGMAIRFQVRSRDEYTNIDFIEPLEQTEEAEKAEEEPAEERFPYSKKEIKAMKGFKLKKVAKELELDPDDFADEDELRDAILETAGL